MNLFLLPHQDDEYGVFSILEKLAAAQEQVTVAYLTTGTLDGRPSVRRNDESLSVLKHLGIDRKDVLFIGESIGIPDSQLWRYIDGAIAGLLDRLSDGHRVSSIYTPAWEGGHQDHDAAYIIACYLAQEFACVQSSRQFPLYNGRGLPGPMWRTFDPMSANGEVHSATIPWRARFRYLLYCLSYRSQLRTWMGLLPMYALSLMLKGKQFLQPLVPLRLKEEPHSGTCLYERRGFCSRAQFVYHTKAMVDKILARNQGHHNENNDSSATR